jgi:hypothetical protein
VWLEFFNSVAKSPSNSIPQPSLFTLEDLLDDQMGVQLFNSNAVIREFIHNRKGAGRT